jgi:mono/diheme cytochrome c family protein
MSAYSADLSGEALFNEHCLECHNASNFAGGNRNKLAETIGKMAVGHKKHKVPIPLNQEEVEAVARYMSGS